jgi:cell wall-associated NlpC family hydrolase
VRAHALSTSIVSIFALAVAVAPATAATRQASPTPSATTTCVAPPTTSPTAPVAPPAIPAAPAPAPVSTVAASLSSATAASAGGAAYGLDPDQTPTMPSGCIIDGKAYPPADAPLEVQQAIWAANAIVGKPYKYGGGHAKLRDTGYDCSGTVSFALIGGGLQEDPLDSSSYMRWGDAGPGSWITIYTNPGHAYVVIAGMRLDTSAAGDPSGNSGPQWRPVLRSAKGFKVRHPVGF